VHPVLLRIGPLTLYSWGVMVSLGIMLALYLAGKKCEEFGVKRESLIELLSFILIPGAIFARVFYAFFTEPSLLSEPLLFLNFFRGGLSIHGAILGGIIGILVFSQQRRVSFFKISDLTSLFLPLAQSVGRIGCFLNGDSYGTITSVFWGVKFPGLLGRRHPTQIYESILTLFLFIFLFYLYHKKLFKLEGNLTLSYLIGYSLIRFFIEFFRESVFWGHLKIAQWASLSIIIASLPLVYYRNVYKKPS
jgi:phosphatidylglycerol:prolipoprotein diacylglycerol transferase